MDQDSFASRLVTYSDALAALSFFTLSALGIAAADPDIRCSLVEGATEIQFINIVLAIIATGFIVVLRRWEMELRSSTPLTDRAQEISKSLHIARLVIVWLATSLAVLLVWKVVEGSNCFVGTT